MIKTGVLIITKIFREVLIKESVESIGDFIALKKNKKLKDQGKTLIDDVMRDFAREYNLKYNAKWMHKILDNDESKLMELDKTLYDRDLLEVVFNKVISADEIKKWNYLMSARLAKEDMVEVRNFLDYKKEEPEDEQPLLFTAAAPLPPEKEYIEREQEEEIMTLLQNKKKLVLVNGLGGVGKSAICKRMFQNLRAHEDIKLGWINYNGKDLKSDFVAQFKYPKKNRKEWMTYFLQADIDPNAIIFIDNFNVIEREDPYIKELASARCNVICTSRVTNFEWFETVPIDVFELEKCVALFKKYAKIDENDKNDDETIKMIAKCVGCHTLTLEILGKICWVERRQPSEVLKELREKGINVSGEAEVELQEYTLVEHLLRIFPVEKLNKDQKYILYHLAICSFEHAPKDILEWIGIERRLNVGLLERYGWYVYEAENKTYYMHPIIRAVVLKVCEPEKAWFDKLIYNLATITRYDRKQGSAKKEIYRLYLKKIIELTEKYEIINADVAQLYFNLSVIEQFRKNYGQAIHLLKKELELWDKMRSRGSERKKKINTKVANIKVQIGTNYYYMNELKEALKWYKQVEQMKGTYEDKELEEQMGSNCGLVYQKQAEALLIKGEDADKLLKKAIKGFESTINAYLRMGKNDLHVAIGYRNLADCQYKMKHYQEATSSFETAKKIAEVAVENKENNVDMERIYGQLAYAYDAWGDSLDKTEEKREKYEMAIIYYKKCHDSCNVNYYKGISWIKLDELEEKWNVCRKKMAYDFGG